MKKRAVPSGWRLERLGGVVAINPDQLGEDAPADLPIEYVELSGVAGLNAAPVTQSVQFGEAPSRARRRAKNGDILVATVRPNLRGFTRVRNAPTNLVVSTGFAVLRPNGDADGEFLYQHILGDGFVQHLLPALVGSNYPAVNPDTIASYPVALPPPAEQTKIAAVLGAVDEAVEQGRAVLAQTKTLRQALLHTLLTRGLPGERTKFKTVRLGDVYAERSEHGIAGLPVMSVTNSGLVVRSTTDRRVESELPDEGHALVRKDDIAYNMMRMWQGVSCLADRDCLVSPAYVVCSPKKGIVPQYGAYLLKAPHVVQLLRLHSQGVHEDRLRLYYKHFAPIKVEIPDEDTQRSSVRMIASLDARVAAAESHLTALEKVKSALSAALLTGAIRVPAGREVKRDA